MKLTENQLKQWLELFPTITQEIIRLQIQLREAKSLQEEYISIPIANLEESPIQTGQVSDPTYRNYEKITAKYGSEIAEIEDEIDDLLNTRSKVRQMMKWLKYNGTRCERKLIYFKYFKQMTVNDLCYELKYERSNIGNITKSALSKLLSFYNDKKNF